MLGYEKAPRGNEELRLRSSQKRHSCKKPQMGNQVPVSENACFETRFATLQILFQEVCGLFHGVESGHVSLRGVCEGDMAVVADADFRAVDLAREPGYAGCLAGVEWGIERLGGVGWDDSEERLGVA